MTVPMTVPIVTLQAEEKLNIYSDSLFTGEQFLPGKGFLLSLKGGCLTSICPAGRELIKDRLALEKTFSWPFQTTVMPGLVDCHLHLALNGRGKSTGNVFQPEDFQWLFKDLLQAGVVAARDGGDALCQGLQLARYSTRVKKSGLPVPLIISTGAALFKKGHYGSFLGKGFACMAEAFAMLEELGRKGVEQVKILFSGIVSFNSLGKVGPLPFSRKEAFFLVNKAHSLGLKVMAHASSDEAVQMALQAGADTIEHGYFVQQSTLEQMAEKQVPWIPTLAPVALQLEKNGLLGRRQRHIIAATWERQGRALLLAHRLGVPLAVGTDAGAPGVDFGRSVIKEMQLWAEAGLPLQQILRSATLEGARVMGKEKELGRIEPGKKPCLLVVRGNLREDLFGLEKPLLVII